MDKYLKYAKAFDASEEVLNWLKVNLANYLKDNTENQQEIEHIIDFLVSDKAPKRLKKIFYGDTE